MKNCLFLDFFSVGQVFRFETELKQAPIVITDANLPTETMNYVCQQCRLSKIPGKLFFFSFLICKCNEF